MGLEKCWTPSGSPKAFQGVIYHFWTGQHQPCFIGREKVLLSNSKTRNEWMQMKSPSVFCTKRKCFKTRRCLDWNGFVLLIRSSA